MHTIAWPSPGVLFSLQPYPERQSLADAHESAQRPPPSVMHVDPLGQSDGALHSTLHMPAGYMLAVSHTEPAAQPLSLVQGPPTTSPDRPTA